MTANRDSLTVTPDMLAMARTFAADAVAQIHEELAAPSPCTCSDPAGTWLVTFERIGRTHDVAPLRVAVEDADELAERISRYARPYLCSSDVQAVVNLAEGRGFILCGFNNGGDFTVVRDDEPGGAA
jgi:hypothetical protein